MATARSSSKLMQDKELPSTKEERKLRGKVKELIALAQRLYPQRYVRIEPKPNVYQGPIISEHVYRIYTCPKPQQDDPIGTGQWMLVQEGSLSILRDYMSSEIESGKSRKT